MAEIKHYLDQEGLQILWGKIKDNFGALVQGYYFNGKFYTDSTYTSDKLITGNYLNIYFDKNSKLLYSYNGTEYVSAQHLADNLTAGMMKLYQNSGENTDGTMSQKVITEGVNDVKFTVDEADAECLVLNKPW